jgi:hypothetical protein
MLQSFSNTLSGNASTNKVRTKIDERLGSKYEFIVVSRVSDDFSCTAKQVHVILKKIQTLTIA